MLRSRVLTALVMAAVLLTAIFTLDPLPLTVGLALLVLVIGGWEGAGLAGLGGALARTVWIAFLLAFGAGLLLLIHQPGAAVFLFAIATGIWLGHCIALAWPDRGRPTGDELQWRKLFDLSLILGAAFISLAWLHAGSPWLVLALILVIAGADIGAYFTGHAIGGTKLAPRISPGKTRSGAVGGMVVGALAGAATSQLPDVPYGPLTGLGAGALLALLSIGGDLTLSLMKRHRGVKDTSNLLPGHGGILDRIDSLGAAAPAFALLVWFTRAVAA